MSSTTTYTFAHNPWRPASTHRLCPGLGRSGQHQRAVAILAFAGCCCYRLLSKLLWSGRFRCYTIQATHLSRFPTGSPSLWPGIRALMNWGIFSAIHRIGAFPECSSLITLASTLAPPT